MCLGIFRAAAIRLPFKTVLAVELGCQKRQSMVAFAILMQLDPIWPLCGFLQLDFGWAFAPKTPYLIGIGLAILAMISI